MPQEVLMSNRRVLRSVVLCYLFVTMGIVVADTQSPVPGWVLSGNATDSYAISLDPNIAYNGSGSASLKSVAIVSGVKFGTLMQSIDASRFRGERLKLSAQIMTKDVMARAALWMRIDDCEGNILGSDNMGHRQSIRGDTTWRSTEVVLDIPHTAKRIAYGVLL